MCGLKSTRVIVDITYSQSFSRYFFFVVNPIPKVATSNINVKIIIGTFDAPTAKLNNTKKTTANIENTQKIFLDFFCFILSPPFAYLFSIIWYNKKVVIKSGILLKKEGNYLYD